MLTGIERVRAEVEAGVSREELRALLPPCGARNALDAALWELESFQQGKPIWQLAGLPLPKPLITTFTIGADPPNEVLATLDDYASAKSIKIKLDGDVDGDSERVSLVRELRPGVWLMVDANQGYDRDRLERLLPVLVSADVAILEQPCKRGSEAELDGLDSSIPIAADESLLGLEELPALVGRFQVANIKLDKCGGLTEALLMEKQARRLGLKVMVGNMGGSSLAAAPAFLFGQLCDYADLDGPKFIRADLLEHVSYQDGRIHCPPNVWGFSNAQAR
jgi:L-alanine-DL-glutamate epimerase-like enolase superfamily enzyme